MITSTYVGEVLPTPTNNHADPEKLSRIKAVQPYDN